MANQEYPRGEIARRGDKIFERDIRPELNPETEAHAFIAIDIETGDYEVSESELEAMDRLTERQPEAEGRIWLRRVGSPSAYHIGGRFHISETEGR